MSVKTKDKMDISTSAFAQKGQKHEGDAGQHSVITNH